MTLLVGTVILRPSTARAQQPGQVRRIAWLGLERAGGSSPYVDSLRVGLRDLGWIEGRNLSISLYWAGRDDMDSVARELVASNPDVIVTQELMVFPVQRQKSTSPVVFGFSGDPVENSCKVWLGRAANLRA